jgi:hypothetical protein
MYIRYYAHNSIYTQVNPNRQNDGARSQLLKNKPTMIMGRISADLPDELEKQLRLKTVQKFGGKKGDLSRAVEEAIKAWISEQE